MNKAQVAIVGAGPAGLVAAIEVAKAGGEAVLLDENNKPGGQLFKQIHKFFGSREHQAGIRGYDIGLDLLKQTQELGVKVLLGSPVYGLYPHGEDTLVSYMHQGREKALVAEKVILATGASENGLAFPGCGLIGVMGAGAAQTMINVHRVLPGKKVVMLGSGNVGLIVSYQLLQAGADVVALVEAAPSIGGYGVHAAKIRRAGTPVYVGHTVKAAHGKEELESLELVALDSAFQPIAGTERTVEADTLCIAVGLTPLVELAALAGCAFTFNGLLGGQVPAHDANMRTSLPGVYVAGDIAGVEEASSAMEEGRLAGIAVAEALGLYTAIEACALKATVWDRMNALRTGPFGQKRYDAKCALIEAAKEVPA